MRNLAIYALVLLVAETLVSAQRDRSDEPSLKFVPMMLEMIQMMMERILSLVSAGFEMMPVIG